MSKDVIGIRPAYPKDLVATTLPRLLNYASGIDEVEAIKTITELCLPPANVDKLIRVTTVLYVSRLICRDTYRGLLRYAKRNVGEKNLCVKDRMRAYPLFRAISVVYKNGRDHLDDGKDAVQLLVSINKTTPERSSFVPDTYYRHLLAVRVVFKNYWTSRRQKGRASEGKNDPLRRRLSKYISRRLASDANSDSLTLKLEHAHALLNGTLILGEAQPRGKICGRKRHGLGSEVLASEELQQTIDEHVVVNSATVNEPWADDGGLSSDIDYPKHSTARDRHRITGHVLNGYARTNVRTSADMTACSLVTHRDYLVAAYRNLDGASFTLIWLVSFLGIDYKRSFHLKSKNTEQPSNDEVLLDLLHGTLEYKILRRQQENDSAMYESCGLMKLPIPDHIVAGLAEIIRIASQESSIDVCNKFATKYSRNNAGLTPTLRRLRSGARTHFAPRDFAELDYSAISGRVPPAIKAVSYYYPRSAIDIANRFLDSYEETSRKWRLPKKLLRSAPRLSATQQGTIFCKRPASMTKVGDLYAVIARDYTEARSELSSSVIRPTVQSVIDAVNLHQLSCYALQELGVGLRPTGDVAEFSAASPTLGGMTADKGSRLYSERSYSPISNSHWQLINAGLANESELRRQLKYSGIKLVDEEDNSDLACRFELADDGRTIIRTRLTGRSFHAAIASLHLVIDEDMKGNWLRHVATNHVGGSVPQWQADEFFAHRRVGRESFARWSTTGVEHLQELRERISRLHEQLVPAALFHPIDMRTKQ